MIQALREALLAYDYFVVIYLLVVCLGYLALLLLATAAMTRRLRRIPSAGYDDLFASALAPAITVVASAYNQQRDIERRVRALLNLRYPNHSVVVVNDGSNDDTLGVLQRRFNLRQLDAVYPERVATAHVRGVYISRTEPSLTVVDKEYGGRDDTLNCGVNLARSELVCSVDTSVTLEPDALLRLAQPFMDRPQQVVAVGGGVRIANGARIERGAASSVHLPRNTLAMFQVIEHLRAFLVDRERWSQTSGVPGITGAFGLFQRQLVLEVGGYRSGDGDADLVARIHLHEREQRRRYEVCFIADPLCWVEVPETLPALGAQRRRRARLAAQTFIAQRQFLRPTSGALSPLAHLYAYYTIFGELLGPVIEATACITMPLAVLVGALDLRFAAVVALLAFGYNLFLTLSVLALDEFGYQHYPSLRDLSRLGLYAVIETIGYRQLTIFWRLQGLWQAIRGKRESRGTQGRTLSAAG